jgi:hypothetical protein
MLGGWTVAGGRQAPLSPQDVQRKLGTLTAAKAALDAYKTQFGHYPDTNGAWVQGVAVGSLLRLPADAPADWETIGLRAGDGEYKLISGDPNLCLAVHGSHPDMVDPARFKFSNMPLEQSFEVRDPALMRTARTLMVSERSDPALADHIRAKCWGVGYWTQQAWLW